MLEAAGHTVARHVRRLTAGEGLRAQLLRQGTGVLLLQSTHLFLMLGLTVVMARVLGPQGYGVYAFILALGSLLAIPAQFGLPTLVVRETAKYQVQEDWPRMRGIWIWSTSIVVTWIGALALVAATLVWLAGDRFSSPHLETYFWGMLLIPLLALGTLRGAALRGLRHTVQGQLPEQVILPGLLIVLTLGASAILSTGEFGPREAMALHVFSALCAFLLGASLLSKHRPKPERAVERSVFEHKVWLRATLPLALLTGLQVINKNTDLVMLGLFRNAAEVGIYKVATQVAALVAFGLGVVNTITAPYLTRLHTQGDHVRLQRLLTTSARAILLFALILVAAIAASADWALAAFFGPDFDRGYVPLIILCAGQLANAAFGSVGLLLTMTGHERDTVRGFAAGAFANVFLNAALIPTYGLFGAATATALSLTLWNLVLWRLAKQRLSLNTSVFGTRNFI